MVGHVSMYGEPGTVFGEAWPCGADMLITLERFDGATLGGWSARAELLVAMAPPAGTRRHSAATPSAETLDCEALNGTSPGCPTAASVATACSSVCDVDGSVGGGGATGFAEAKLGAADGAMLAVTCLRHLSSVMSSVGRQIDKMYASESAVASPFLMASAIDVCR